MTKIAARSYDAAGRTVSELYATTVPNVFLVVTTRYFSRSKCVTTVCSREKIVGDVRTQRFRHGIKENPPAPVVTVPLAPYRVRALKAAHAAYLAQYLNASFQVAEAISWAERY